MAPQVTPVSKSAFYQLRNIAWVRKYLSPKTTEFLVHAFLSSKLDFCNSLLYGIPKHLLRKLRSVQNPAARFVTSSTFDHVTPILKDLHWFPNAERIKFKILLLTFKGLHNLSPSYIKELFTIFWPARMYYNMKFHADWMRLTNVSLWHEANWMKCYLNLENCWRTDRKYNESINKATLWNEAFNLSPSFGLCDASAGDWVLYKTSDYAISAPELWNQLPDDIRSSDNLSTFKSKLKRHFFNIAFQNKFYLNFIFL